MTWVVNGQTVETDANVPYGTTPTFDGTTPTKPDSTEKTYTFTGWLPAVGAISGDTEYVAQFSESPRKYTVLFVTDNNETVSSAQYDYGTAVADIVVPAGPAKTSTAQFDYTFAGWGTIVEVTGDATYTASYTPVLRSYTITFENYDGTELQSSSVAYGQTPSYSGAEDPVKPADAQYTYTFSGWSPEVASVSGEATYTAQFTPVARPTLALAKPTLSSTVLANAQSGAVVRATISPAAEVTGASATTGVSVDVDGATATFTSLPWNEAVDWTLSAEGASAALPGRFYAKGETEWFDVETNDLEAITGLAEGMKGVDKKLAPSASNQMVRIQTALEIPEGAMEELPGSTGVGSARTGFAVAQIADNGDTAPAFYAYTGDDEQGVNGWVKLLGAEPTPGTKDLLIVLDVEAATPTARYYVDGIALHSGSAQAPAYAIPMKRFADNEAKQIKGIGFANPDGVATNVVAEYDVPFEAAVGDVPYLAAADGLAAADKTGVRTLYLLTNDVAGTISLAANESVKVDTAKGSFAAAEPVVLADGLSGYEIVSNRVDSLTTYTVELANYAISYELDGGAWPTGYTATNTYTVESPAITLASPTKTDYNFLGWVGTGLTGTNATVTIAAGSTGDRAYTSIWQRAAVTIRFLNYDGSVLQSSDVDIGQTPVYSGETPAKPATAQYSYEWTGWEPAIVAAAAAADYTATFSETLRSYDVTFSWHGDSETTSYEYGQTPTAPAIPASYVENGKIYTFQNWNAAIVSVEAAATYTAVYDDGVTAVATVFTVANNGATTNTVGTYATLAQAVAATVDGATVLLLDDVTLTERVEPNVGANTAITIDLGGNTITRTGTSGNGSAFDVKSGDVTIRNGEIDCTQDDTAIAKDGVYAITSRSGSNVTLADLDITVNSECGACAYPFAGSTMTIESGTYANTTTTPYRYNTAITGMAVNQPNNATQNLIIKGGSFSQYDPQLGDDSGAMTDFTDDGFVAIDDGNGHWVVQPGYNVTFDANGGDPAPAAQRVAAGGTADAPAAAPAKDGSVFAGWTLNGAAYDFDTVLSADITLVAAYDTAVATVFTVANNGATTNTVGYYTTLAGAVGAAVDGATVLLLDDVTFDTRVEPNVGANTAITIDLGGNTITRTGTSGNGSAFDVKSGDVTIRNGEIDCTQDDTAIAKDGVYAITSRSGSNVTLADLDITVNSECGACAYPFAGSTMTIESGTYANTTTTPYRYNTAITGMAVNQPNNATQNLIIKGGSFSQYDPQLGDDSGAMTDFTAEGFVAIADGNGNWVVQPGYNVTFDANGGSPTPDAQRVADGGKATEPDDPAKEHYSLRAWTLSGSDFDFDTVLTADIELVADWSIDTFTVSWVVTGATVRADSGVPYGSTTNYVGETPAKDADAQFTYTFAGWTTNGVDVTPASVEIVADTTFTAKFTEATNQYTVIWIVDGTPTTNKVDYGTVTSTIRPADPTKTGDAGSVYTFTGWSPAVAETVTGNATYTAQFSSICLVPASLELYPNCSNYVHVVGAPEGSTYTYKFAGQVGCDSYALNPPGWSKTEGWAWPYGKQPGGTGTITVTVSNNNAQVAQFVANVTVKDVAAVVDGVEYSKDQFADAMAAAVAGDSVLGVYYYGSSYGKVALEEDESIRWKPADNRGKSSLWTSAVTVPATTDAAWYKAVASKDNETGITTITCEDQGVPYVKIDDGTTVTYATDYFPGMEKTGSTYTMLRDVERSGSIVASAANVVLDLNGHELTLTKGSMNVRGGLTVVDNSQAGTGSIVKTTATGTDTKLFLVTGGASVAIEGGTFESAGDVLYTDDNANSSATISGGTFSSTAADTAFLLNCSDSNKGAITVTGGSFQGFNPQNNTADGANTDYVAEGYYAFPNDPSSGWYTVAEKKSVIGTTITVADAEYDGTAKEPVPTVTFGEATLTATDDYTVAYSSNTNAGVNTAVVTITGVNGWKDFTNVTFTIAQRPLFLTAMSDSKVYDGTPLTKEGIAYDNPGQLLDGHDVAYVVTGSQTDAGTSDNVLTSVTIKDANQVDVTANYELTLNKGTLTVTRAPIAFPTAASGLVYDGNEQTGVATGTGYTLGGTFAATAASNYVAIATPDSNHEWSAADYVPASIGATDPLNIEWSIAKAEITVTVTGTDAASAVYTGSAQTANVAYTLTCGDTLYDESKVSYSGDTTVSGTNVGSYPFGLVASQFSYGDENVDATFTVTDGTFAITSAKVAVPTAVAGLVYNGNLQTGVVENVGYTLTGNTATDAGSYTATATLAANYEWDADPATGTKTIGWSIAKAPLSDLAVTLQGWTENDTANNPSVTGNAGGGTETITYWSQDGETQLSGQPTAAGTYTVKVEVAETTNYQAGSATATFTIDERGVWTIIWLADDGSEIDRTQVTDGNMPTHADATKTDATGKYAYTFAGWSPAIVAATQATNYTATFSTAIATPLALPLADHAVDATVNGLAATVAIAPTGTIAGVSYTAVPAAAWNGATTSFSFEGLDWNAGTNWTVDAEQGADPLDETAHNEGVFYAKASTELFTATTNDFVELSDLGVAGVGYSNEVASAAGEAVRVHTTIDVPDEGLTSEPDVGDAKAGFAVLQLTGDAKPAFYAYNGTTWTKLYGVEPKAGEADYLAVYDFAAAEPAVRYYIDGVPLYAAGANDTKVYAIPLVGMTSLSTVAFGSAEMVKDDVVAVQDVSYVAAVGETPYTNVVDALAAVAAADKAEANGVTLSLLKANLDPGATTVALAAGEAVTVDATSGSFAGDAPFVAADAPTYKVVTTGTAPVLTYKVELNLATVIWLAEDGTTEVWRTNAVIGTVPVYEGPAQTKDATAAALYTFSGWTNAAGVAYAPTDAFPAVAIGGTNYVATFKAWTKVARPTVASGLEYTGDEQPGVTVYAGSTVTAGDVKGTNAGAYSATVALDSADSVWADATDPADATARETVTANWSIARKAVTVTADNKSKIAGNADPELTATVSGTVGTDTVDYTVTRATGETAGEYVITASGSAEQGNYNVTFAPGTFTISGAAAMVISVADAETGATTTNYVATLADAFGPNGATDGETVELLGDVTLDARILVQNSVTIDLGGHTITRTAAPAGDNGSAFRVDGDYDVTIKNGAIDCSGVDDTSVIGDGVFAIDVKNGGDLTLADLDITVDSRNGACVYPWAGSTVTIESGSYANLTDEPYDYHKNAAGEKDWVGMAVNQANGQAGSLITITGGTFSKLNPMLGDDSAAEGTMSFVDPDFFAVGDGGVFTVVPRIDIALATVTVADDLVYDGTGKAGVTSVDYGITNLVLDTDYAVAYAANTNAGVETASATITGVGLWTGTVTTNFSIAPMELTVTAASDTKTYDGTPLTKDDYTATALATGDAFQTVTVEGTITNVGAESNKVTAVSITNALGADVTANYDITTVDGELEVTKAAITITVAGTGSTATYTGAEQTGTVAYTLASNDALYDESKVVFSGDATVSGTNVGDYPYGLADADFSYNDANIDATFQVTDADFSITAATATIPTALANLTYDGTEQTGVAEGTGYTIAGNKATNAGEYTATLTLAENYKWSDDTADATKTVAWSIAKKAATITVANASKKHGEADPAFTGTVSVLVAEGDLGTVTYGRTNDTEAVGVYAGVIVPTYTANANYDVTVTPGTFTIEENKITIIWVVDGKQTETEVEWGETPVFAGSTDKASDAKYDYTFSGWTDGEAQYAAGTDLPAVAGEATYTATYAKTIGTPLALAVADEKLDSTAVSAAAKTATVAADLIGAVEGVTVTEASGATVTIDEDTATASFTGLDWNQGVEWTMTAAQTAADAAQTAESAELPGKFYVKPETAWFTATTNQLEAVADASDAAVAYTNAVASNEGEMVRIHTKVAVPAGGLPAAPQTGSAKVGFAVLQLENDTAPAYYAFGNGTWTKLTGVAPAEGTVDYYAVYDLAAETPTARYYIDGVALCDTNGVYALPLAADVISLSSISFASKEMVKDDIVAEQDVSYVAAVGGTPYTDAEAAVTAQGKNPANTMALLKQNVGIAPVSLAATTEKFVVDYTLGSFTNDNPAVSGVAGYDVKATPDGENDKLVTYALDPVVYPIDYVLALASATNAVANPTNYTVEGAVAFLPAGAPGYTFEGWTNATGAVVAGWAAGGMTGAVTNYASWTVNKHTVTYKVTGDYFANDAFAVVEDVAYGTPLSPIETDMAKEGYTFSGWTGLPETMPDEDVVVTGSYSIDSFVLTIAYVYTNGTEAAQTFTSNVVYGTAYSVASPAIVGYTPDKVTVAGDMGAADVNVTVTYAIDRFKVTFVDEDGTTLKAATEYDYGTLAEDIAKPEDPTKAATADWVFTFAGWTPALANVTNDATYTATYTSNATVAAVITIADNGDGTATTNTAYVASLADAIAAANDGDTVQLLADVSEPAVDIEDDIMLDLNGNTWTVSGTGEPPVTNAVTVAGNVTIVDSSENGGGAISSAAAQVLVVDAADEEGATASVTIGEDAAIVATGAGATALGVVDGTATVEGTVTGNIAVAADGALTVDGGTVTGDVAATGGDVTVADGTVDGTITAAGDTATVAVSGGSVTDGVAVSNGADVTVSDGSVAGGITAVDDGSSVTVSDDGSVTDGVAVSDGADVTVSGGSVAGGVSAEDAGSTATITGGEIAGGVTVADGATGSIEGDETVVNGTLDGTTGTLSITDGLFEEDPTDYLAEGYVAIETAQGYDVRQGKSVIGTTITVAGGTYNGQAYEIGSIVLGNYTLTADDYTVVYTNETTGVLGDNVNAGTVIATVTGKGEWIDSTNVTFAITQKLLTITANDLTVPFRTPADAIEYTFSYDGFVTGETNTTALTSQPTASLDPAYNPATAEAGDTFDIVPSGAAAANYYFSYVKGTLTIGAAEAPTMLATTSIAVDGTTVTLQHRLQTGAKYYTYFTATSLTNGWKAAAASRTLDQLTTVDVEPEEGEPYTAGKWIFENVTDDVRFYQVGYSSVPYAIGDAMGLKATEGGEQP